MKNKNIKMKEENYHNKVKKLNLFDVLISNGGSYIVARHPFVMIK